ncbi:hypothetical protein QWY93_01535 [Echinicola jeungdonensis]|uniref:Uncharacterized protein n=1 Tax=Echinicola jeungdonensis TaxID=709343 RepID=A0ABV5J4T7_9BACT|nr:hypothetical protein [Echinicola jeungdonensis]MDN3668021.1 hypothetical protein [Echinicola jeungdonensis]
MEKAPKIRIVSKQLASGNHQVKFFVEDEMRPRYGYLLVKGNRLVGEVIAEIRERMEMMEKSTIDLHRFSFKNTWQDDHNFYLYSA